MNDQEGSKAMTIYIVACFVLAMAALVGYKYTNDNRESLATDYVRLAGMFADMSAAFAPNIEDYYLKVQDGSIEEVDKETRDATRQILERIADDLGIMDGTGRDDHRDIGAPRPNDSNKLYMEYELTAQLKRVSQDDWAKFLSHATRDDKLRQYIRVKEIVINRENTRFERMDLVDGVAQDRTLWTVDITFVWFGPPEEREET